MYPRHTRGGDRSIGDSRPLPAALSQVLDGSAGARAGWRLQACAAIALAATAAATPIVGRASTQYEVTTAGDPGGNGSLSLRQAVGLAVDGDSITFDAALKGSVLTLSLGQIGVFHSISIEVRAPTS